MLKRMTKTDNTQSAGRRAVDAGGLRNERGIALILALVMLTLLGMLGIFALGTSSTALHIAGNYRNHELAFYNADVGEAFGVLNQGIMAAINPYVTNSTNPTPVVTNSYLGQTTVTVQFLCLSRSVDQKKHEFHYRVTITGTGANNAQFSVVSQMKRAMPLVELYSGREDC